MKKLLIALFLFPACMLFADGGSVIVPAGSNYMLVPPVISSDWDVHLAPSSNRVHVAWWTNNQVYAAGAMVRIPSQGGMTYIAMVGGTSGGTAPATGPYTLTDGSVTWLRAAMTPRTGLVVQYVSGGVASVTWANGGGLSFTTAGSAVTFAAPSCYNGAVFGSATGTNVTFNVTGW